MLREREPGLGDHLHGVARLAAEVGRAVGLDAEELDVVVRAYRGRQAVAEPLAELRRCAGTQFDPWLVELFAERVIPRLAAVLEPVPVLARGR